MHAILVGGLASAAGAAIGWEVGRRRGEGEAGRARRRAVTEIVVAGVVGASLVALGIEGLSGASPPWFLLGGAAWSLLCEVGRIVVTRRLRRASDELHECLADKPDRRTWPRAVIRHARGWPSAFWLEMLHAAGLSDVTDSQMHAYLVYRSQVAWETKFFGRRQDHLSFATWIWRKERPTLLIAVVGIALYSWMHSAAPAYTGLVQAVVVLLFLVWVRDPLINPERLDDVEAARMFHRCWCALLASWFVYYLMVFSTKVAPTVPPPGVKDPPYGPREVAMQFIDNLNTCFLLFGYFVLRDPPSLVGERSHRWRGWTPLRWKGFGLAVALAIFSVADAIWAWRGWPRPVRFFEWIGGTASGVALALVIARLESKWIGAPTAVIALLYVYAVLQGTMVGFAGYPEAENIFFLFALLLKSLFVLFLAWVFASQRLAVYFERLHRFGAIRRAADDPFADVVLDGD